MPANLTHQYFAKKMTPLIATYFPFVTEHESALLLGTQGPDPFFFYGCLPWLPSQRKSAVHESGARLHKLTGQEALLPLFQVADTDQEKTYAIGALLHYILDCIVHPFVFCKSGFDETGQLTAPYSNYHAHYETMMDIDLLHQLPAHEYLRPTDTFKVSREGLLSISRLYHRAFSWIASDDFFHGTMQMRDIFRILYSPFASKRSLLSLLFGKEQFSLALAVSLKTPRCIRFDYLNISKTVWFHPVTMEVSYDSVPMLFDKATRMVSEQCQMLHLWFQGNAAIGEACVLPPLNYDGDPVDQRKVLHQSIYVPQVQSRIV